MSRRLFVALALVVAFFGSPAREASASPSPGWGNAAIVERENFPVFEYRGKPFFLYGAAFFYERLPRELWNGSMDALQTIGINTLDLYVPWNWHETADGSFDFSGRTNPRRDLDEVLRLAKAHDFAIVLRPGPVVRNEWRNGGYPAWLLERPEYGMPLHDLLEGRYPPTATLQNAHSDDAAAQWMRNATHVRYARRWLERALRECAPYADRIVAVALDDDQGAYIDNQTYPAPHFRAYLSWLRGVVQGVTGPREPVFINTYQMKVPASSPVWAMGNWYQSEAYTLGEHDRAQLEFSTSLLHTRPHQPLFASEFQAGWLQGPDDVRPRPADPGNTSLAIGTLFGLGVRGIVNFPAQDTLYPSGWEAPFANGFYAWDAALELDGTPAPRALPTAEFGSLVRRFGPQLAAARPIDDAAIAYLGASFADADATNDLYGQLAGETIAAQQACRAAGLACTLVDPQALGNAALGRYPLLIVPRAIDRSMPPLLPGVRAKLRAYERGGGRIVAGTIAPATIADAFRATGREPIVSGIYDARFARTNGPGIAGFLTVVNYGNDPTVAAGGRIRIGTDTRMVPSFTIPAHRAVVIPVALQGGTPQGSGATKGAPPPIAADASAGAASGAGVPIRDDARLPALPFRRVEPGTAVAYFADVYRDADTGNPGATVLDNGLVRVVVAPDAGARAFVFEDVATGRNVFTSVGGLRDDVAVEPPLSASDRIAKYTHQMPAGTFNRPYRAELVAGAPGLASARFAYDAPDIGPAGARFVRDLTLAAGARAFNVDESAVFAATDGTTPQRAVSVTSLAVGRTAPVPATLVLAPLPVPFATGTTLHVSDGHALGYFDPATGDFASIAWRAGDVEEATVEEKRFSILVRLTLAPGKRTHLRFGYTHEPSPESARRTLAGADAASGEVPGSP